MKPRNGRNRLSLSSVGCRPSRPPWADWDLTHEDRLQLAAEWFQQQMREFIAFDLKGTVKMVAQKLLDKAKANATSVATNFEDLHDPRAARNYL